MEGSDLLDPYFHALNPDPEDEHRPGFPCLYRIRNRPPDATLDDLWLVWIGGCFYRKPRTQVVYRDWDLAFETYWHDIHFNAPKGQTPRFPNKDVLRRAYLRCLKAFQDQDASSKFVRLKACTKAEFLHYVEPWEARLSAASHGEGSRSSESESRSNSERSGDDWTSDEEGSNSEGGSGMGHGAGGGEQGRGEPEEPEEPEEEREVDPLYADLLEEIRERPGGDPFEEGIRLGKAYEAMCSRHQAEQYRRKIMRETVDEVEEKLRPLGALVAFMVCSSLNKYDTLRFIISEQAHKPFSYKNPATQEDVPVDPQLCSRAIYRKTSAAHRLPPNSLFTWSKAELKDSDNLETRLAAISEFSSELEYQLQASGKPVPKRIVFVSNLDHGRGNNFLLIYSSREDAAAARCLEVQVLDHPITIHAVVNRRSKLRLSRGINVPSFLPTKQDAATQGKAMTEHVLGYFVDRVVAPSHMCAGGKRTLAEKSVRLKDVPPSIDAAQLLEWVKSEAGIVPSQIVRDNLARNNAAAMAGSAGTRVVWVLECNSRGDCLENEEDVQKALLLHNRVLGGATLKAERIRARGAGGRFVEPLPFSEKLLGDAAASGLLRPTPAGVHAEEGASVEFADGTSVVGNSVTGSRTRILSPAFLSGASKLDRTWDVIGSEGKAWAAQVCLTEDQLAELTLRFPELRLGRHVSIATMRYVLQRFLKETVLVRVHEDGTETRVRAPVRWVVGDIKSLCIHMGQDNKCPCCELPYEEYDQRLYGANLRTPESNMARWQSYLTDVAKIVGAACEDAAFASSLTKVASVANLEGKLEEATAKLELQVCREAMAELFPEIPGQLFLSGEARLDEYEAKKGLRQDMGEKVRKALAALLKSVANLPLRVRKVLTDGGWELQRELVACCACERGTGLSADLGWVKKEQDAVEVLQNVAEACAEGEQLQARFATLKVLLEGATDARGLWSVLEDRELPGCGFKGKERSAIDAQAKDLNPISKTRMESLLKFIKARNAHVTGRPVDFLHPSAGADTLPCPEVVPGIMHTCQKVGKKVLKLLQKEAFGSAEGASNKESNLEYVSRQIALVKTELLVKDEEKAGDNISLAMNCESIRLIFNRWPEMFGDLLSRQWAILPQLLSIVYSIVYSGCPPTAVLGIYLWVATNLVWNLTRVLDQLASLREKKDRKPVVQSNHFHCFAAELPRVYENSQPLLTRLGSPFHMLTEEAGEAYQKVAKTEGYNHSDRKTNVVDTMYRGEQMRDWAIMAYGMRAQNFSALRKPNTRFAKTRFSDLAISACLYAANPTFRSTILSLMANLASKAASCGALYVYTPPPSPQLSDAEPGSCGGLFAQNRDHSRACACTCFCKCADCSQKCLCKCAPGCSCLARSGSCRCRRMPLLFLVARKEGDDEERSFLSVKWCASEYPSSTRLVMDQLLSGGATEAPQPELLLWQRAPSNPGGSSLLPCTEYMRQQAQSLFQASARAHLLRKHLLPNARLRLRCYEEGVAVTSVAPATGSPACGTVLRVHGRGFWSMRPNVPVVRVGGEKAENVHIITDSVLQCTVPPGVGSRLAVHIIPQFEVLVPGLSDNPVVLGGGSLGLILQKAFSYDGPTVDSVQPGYLPTEGGRLHIRGANLDGTRCSVTAAAGRHYLPAVAIGSNSASSLELLLGPGVGTGYRLELTNRTGVTFIPFGYEGPVIDQVNVSNKTVCTEGGSTILVQGQNFGPPGLLNCQSVRIGGLFARCTVISPHTLLEVTTPSSAGGKQPVHVFVGERGYFSEKQSELHETCFLQFAPPEVTSCTQRRSPGDLIRIYGKNFGCGKSCVVTFGGQSVTGTVAAHHHEIVCAVPETLVGHKRGSQSEVLVCVEGQWSAKGITYEYKADKEPRVVPREGDGQSGVPSVQEATTIFVQWRLAVRYSALHQEGAAQDLHGRAFTKESVAAAIARYTQLETLLQNRAVVKKQVSLELSAAMQAAWAEERLRRGLPESFGKTTRSIRKASAQATSSGKRQKT